MRKWSLQTQLAVLLLASCSTSTPLETQTFLGLEQARIIEQMGEPDEVTALEKTSDHIFGPIETLWYEMETGDTLTTWTYKTSNGRKELYFTEGSTVVAGEFFWFHDQSKNPVF